jgi:hypothetical protein
MDSEFWEAMKYLPVVVLAAIGFFSLMYFANRLALKDDREDERAKKNGGRP